MDNIFGQLKTLVETDKAFIGDTFLSYYARIVFGKKLDPIALKSATLLSKEIKAFVETIKKKQKDIGVTMINLSDVEKKILDYIGKSFTLNSKVVDGDVALDKFKNLIAKDPCFNTIENVKISNSYMNQEELTNDLISEIQTSFSNKKCMYSALGQYECLRSFINDGYKECMTFEDFVTKMSELLKTALLDVQAYEYDAVNSLDLSSTFVSEVKTNNDNSKKISTGYKVFDSVLTGGFQPQRVYMFGGISGGGKSLVLVNFAFRSKMFIDKMYQDSNERKKHAILYLSLENSVSETRDRFVCCTLGQSIVQIESALSHNLGPAYESAYREIFNENTTSIYIVYRPAKSINVYDVQNIINDIERTSCKKIDICFIDYADKMSAINASKSDQEWRDLGYIVDEMKSISIGLNIPIVTVTQLNRESYKKDKDNTYSSPTGGNISGSIRKRENVDFFAIFNFKAKEEKHIDVTQLVDDELNNQNVLNSPTVPVECSIDKNRMGPDNLKFNVYIDYPTYRMLNYPSEKISTQYYTNLTLSPSSHEEDSEDIINGFNVSNFKDTEL